MSEALDTWQEKLEYFQKQEAITADPEQKFALHKKIEEVKAKIADLKAAATTRRFHSRQSYNVSREFTLATHGIRGA